MDKKIPRATDGSEVPTQDFILALSLSTQCREQVTKEFVTGWAKEQFEGCDVGEVNVVNVVEVTGYRPNETLPILTFPGVLEVDTERGVIYFHSAHGRTILRVSALPAPVPVPISEPKGRLHIEMLDINFGDMVTGHKVNWDGRVKR